MRIVLQINDNVCVMTILYVAVADVCNVTLNTFIFVPSPNSPFCVPQNTKHTVEAKFNEVKKSLLSGP